MISRPDIQFDLTGESGNDLDNCMYNYIQGNGSVAECKAAYKAWIATLPRVSAEAGLPL